MNKEEKERQKLTEGLMKFILIAFLVIGFFSLSGTNFYKKEVWREKNVEVNSCFTVKNVYDYAVEVYCNVPSTGNCYGGNFGNCDGEVFYGPLSNIVGDPKSNDLRICGYGTCTIRYKTKTISIKSELFSS